MILVFLVTHTMLILTFRIRIVVVVGGGGVVPITMILKVGVVSVIRIVFRTTASLAMG